MTKIYSFPYSQIGYAPPAPIVAVNLWGQDDNSSLTIDALVDSGSDATSVPLSILRQLGARRVEEARMTGIHGISRVVFLYDIWLQIPSSAAMYTTVIADEVNQDVILGRDVLNNFVLTLNGLAQITEIPAENEPS